MTHEKAGLRLRRMLMQSIKSQETTIVRGSWRMLTAAPCSEGWHKNAGLKAQPWKKKNMVYVQ